MPKMSKGKKKKDEKAIILHDADFKSELVEFIKERKERVKKSHCMADTVENGIERLKAKDPLFAAACEAVEVHWLSESNKILNELMEAVRKKAKDETTTLSELARAIDIIAKEHNLFLGKPTSASLVVHHSTQAAREKADEELDKEIIELTKYIEYEPEEVKP